MKQPKVTVGMPAYGHVPGLCVLSFGSFIAHSVSQGYVHHLATCVGAYIDRARNDVVRQVLSNGSTHLMFVDQDMILPELALKRLLSLNKDVVGGLYFGKDDLFTPVAFNFDPYRRVYEMADDEAVNITGWMPDPDPKFDSLSCPCGKPDDHLHKVGGTGMGCTLIRTSVFRRMRKFFGDELWFSSKETGEDVHFAMRCREMGILRWLDGFTQCGHVRDQLVSAQHYQWAKTQQES